MRRYEKLEPGVQSSYRSFGRYDRASDMQASDLKQISDWISGGLSLDPQPEDLMQDMCERLVAAGLQLGRVGVFVRTLHPQIFGRSYVWRPGLGVTGFSAPFGIDESPEFRTSPLSILYATSQEVRRRSAEIQADTGSPFLADLRNEGVTDYIAFPLKFLDGALHAASWTTPAPGGFTDAQVEGLRSLMAPLARVIEIMRLHRTATTLLNTYVGNRAGERILAGQIRRGHAETMRAAIWLSDLRGFTRLSDRMPPEAIVELLNQYFDCQVGPILEQGGEVLKFMGDGLLAVFPTAEDGSDLPAVCQAVLQAARASRANILAMNYAYGDELLSGFRFGLALHVGQVLYGNIGGGNRLDFTCIGPAVNLAARLEKLAGGLNRTVVASEAFAGAFTEGWSDLGEFPIAGFATAQRVYGLPDESAA